MPIEERLGRDDAMMRRCDDATPRRREPSHIKQNFLRFRRAASPVLRHRPGDRCPVRVAWSASLRSLVGGVQKKRLQGVAGAVGRAPSSGRSVSSQGESSASLRSLVGGFQKRGSRRRGRGCRGSGRRGSGEGAVRGRARLGTWLKRSRVSSPGGDARWRRLPKTLCKA
jgi:hypothetical protein